MITVHWEAHPTEEAIGVTISIKDTQGPGTGQQTWFSRYTLRGKRKSDEYLIDDFMQTLPVIYEDVLKRHELFRQHNAFLYKEE